MLLTHLLVNDAATPPPVLAFLAARGLRMSDALTLATRADFPTGAPLHVDSRTVAPDDLNDALTHPALPVALRHEFLSAGVGTLLATVRERDCFTAEELTTIHTRYGQAATSLLAQALARNRHTPRDVAASIVEHLHEDAAADLLALKHQLTPRTNEAHAAASTPDPITSYARHLVALGHLHHPHDQKWWTKMLKLSAHPTLVAGALTHADAIGRHSPIALAIRTAIVANVRIAQPTRRDAANTLDEPAAGDLARTAPADALRIGVHSERSTLDAIAWGSPNITEMHLIELTRTARELRGADKRDYLTAVALHPAATPELRTRAAAALPDHEPDTTLTHRVAATGGHPGTALDVPYADLERLAAAGGQLRTDPNAPRRYQWARAAWDQIDRPATTVEYTQALLGLADARFPGTLRELITTAAAVTWAA